MKLKNKNDIFLFSMILFVVIAIISVVVVVINIWKKSDENDISKYNYSSFEGEVVSLYKKELERLLKKSNSKLLIEKLDNEYLNSIGLSKDDPEKIIEYLNNKHLLSTLPTILDYSLSSNDETGLYVYDFTYRTNGFRRKVYLIETEPYVYSISFEQDYTPSVAKKNVTQITDNIRFELSLLESTSESVKYNIKITNNNDNVVKFDFNNVSSVELYLNDDSKIKLAAVVATAENDFMLTKNSYFNQELFFSVPLDKQSQIKAIMFYNVLIGEEEENIIINF